MMKKFIFALIFCLMAVPAAAADLQWDYPADYDNISGYILYYNEDGETDAPYVKNIDKKDLTRNGGKMVYLDFEKKFRLKAGQSYALFQTGWNTNGESGPSNMVTYTIPVYAPPEDNLPGITITIPNATINIIIGN